MGTGYDNVRAFSDTIDSGCPEVPFDPEPEFPYAGLPHCGRDYDAELEVDM